MKPPKHSKAAINAHPAPDRDKFADGAEYAEACRLVSEARIAFDKPKPVGRPGEYKTGYAEQAKKLCLLGATDKELADFFGIVESTINKWKLDFPEFSESIKAGKIQADAKVAESLYKRATGYTGRKTVTANVAGAITDVKEVDEYVGPDVAAAVFWLKNRQKDKWRDKTEMDAHVTTHESTLDELA